MELPTLAWWARRKGIAVLGTGDVTHPAWREHLREHLRPAEPGLFRLSPEVEAAIERDLPPRLASTPPVRFLLSVEISTIYKRDGHTRKVHHLIYLPDVDAAERFTTRLARIGNVASDGRPILGLDSRDLLEITLESSPDAYLVPAHIWTPWFSALGSKSGFDAIADCYDREASMPNYRRPRLLLAKAGEQPDTPGTGPQAAVLKRAEEFLPLTEAKEAAQPGTLILRNGASLRCEGLNLAFGRRVG